MVYRGDFNEVLYLEDRSHATRRTRGIDEFYEFVDSNELINVPIFRAQYTWYNYQERPSLSKLDRFLISPEWDDYFAPVFIHTLPRIGSEHVLIWLKGGEALPRSGLTPFKFQNMWLLHPGFVELIKGWWEDIEVQGHPGQRFRLKLKSIRDRLQVWTKEVFGDLNTKKKACLEKIQNWDLKEGEESLEDRERIERMEAQQKFSQILEIEEILWKQKSRVQ